MAAGEDGGFGRNDAVGRRERNPPGLGAVAVERPQPRRLGVERRRGVESVGGQGESAGAAVGPPSFGPVRPGERQQSRAAGVDAVGPDDERGRRIATD